MREGSTLAASRQLGINQTTVARRMDVLEHVLGLTLFEKTARGAAPTEAATKLIPLAEALERAAQTFEAGAAVQKGANAPIRITAFENAPYGNIGGVAAQFGAENPDVNFEFVFSERNLDLMKNEADIALRMTRVISDDRLIARKIGQAQWTYYAARSYAATHKLPTEYSNDMEDHRVYLMSHITSARRNLVRCGSANDMITAIQSGQGIGPMPIHVGDADQNLVRCFAPPPGSDLTVWLIASPAAYKRPEVKAFMAFAAPRIARNFKLGV